MNALTRVPFNITTHAINFIAGGRPYSLASAHPAFADLKAALLKAGPHDTEELIGFVDQRVGIMRASYGAIQFDGSDIVYRGQPLHGLWVDKILAFRAAGEDFGPLWNALDRLVKNPTPQAIDRLPVFLERSELGFLEDGRFAAFKGVRSDYMDCYSRTFRNMVGDKPTMDRATVDPDPNATCSRGLHVGTPDYVRSYYRGDNRVMLVAVAPEDVVCVPVDYSGGKMRVTSYEVLEEVPQDYVAELLGRSGNVVRGYTTANTLTDAEDAELEAGLHEQAVANGQVEDEDEDVEFDPDPAEVAKVGDYVEYDDGGYSYVGRVVEVEDDASNRLQVTDLYGDGSWIANHDVERVVPIAELTGAMVAVVGDTVDLRGDARLRDATYKIAGVNDDIDDQTDLDGRTFTVEFDDLINTFPILNRAIVGVYRNGALAWPLPALPAADQVVPVAVEADAPPVVLPPDLQAEVGDLVTTTEGGWPPAGTYPVIRIDEGSQEYRVVVQTEHDGEQAVRACYIALLTPRPWMRAEIGGEVDLVAEDGSSIPAGRYRVMDLRLELQEPCVEVATRDADIWIDATRVTAVYPKA